MTRTTVYLAGKIGKHDWRGSLTHDDRWGAYGPWGDFLGTNIDTGEVPEAWSPVEAGKNLLVTGPFFISCDHGCAHGPASHGMAASYIVAGGWDRGEPCCGITDEQDVLDLCERAIDAADVFFFWMDDRTAYGSLVELGMARKLRKQIIIARPHVYMCAENPYCTCDPNHVGHGGNECYTKDELWFAQRCANEVWDGPAGGHDPFLDYQQVQWDAARALRRLDEHFAPKPPEPEFGSEIERKFWTAFQGRPLAKLLVPQYEFRRANGRTFRPDFAFPDVMLAVELDGFKYHATPEAFAADRDRQREMEMAGWRFVRFTGKEINADVHACIAHTEEFARLIARTP